MTHAETLINGAEFVSAEHALAASLLSQADIHGARKVLAPLVGAGDLDAVILAAKVEAADRDFGAGLGLLAQFGGRFDSASDRLKAWFHMTRGAIYLEAVELDQSFQDNALIDFEQGIYFQRRTGDLTEAGGAANNIGLLCARFGRYREAHDYFRQARDLLAGDPVKLALVDHSAADTLILEGKFYEAEGYALAAVASLRAMDEPRLLRAARRTLMRASSALQASAVEP